MLISSGVDGAPGSGVKATRGDLSLSIGRRGAWHTRGARRAIAASYDYTNWCTYAAPADARKPTPRGLGRARDVRLGNRGCAALIRLAITPAAYAVIVATHPANAELAQSRAPNGEFYVWLEPKYVDRLRAVRKPGESYSDVILRLAEASEGGE